MKKYFLSFAMTLLLALAIVPAAFADTNVSNETELKNALSDSSETTINVTADITLSEPLTISRAVTIDGGTDKNAISYAGGETDYAITTNASGVTLQNLTINRESAQNGVDVQQSGTVIDNCDINAYRRGVNFTITGENDGATLDIKNSVITNTKADETYGVYYDTDNRGVATGNITHGTITITDSQIIGFKYGINPVIDPVNYLRDGEGTVFNVTRTTVQGWTALNIWSADTTYNFTNCTLSGTNKYTGGSNDYATIMANDGIYGGDTSKASTVNIYGGNLISVRHGESIQAAVHPDYQLITQVKFYRYNLFNRVNMLCYGTEEYIGSAFMFSFLVSADNQTNYINSTNFASNVSATYYVINEDTSNTAAYNSMNNNTLGTSVNDMSNLLTESPAAGGCDI